MNHENAAASCSGAHERPATTATAADGKNACSAVTFQPPWYQYSLRGSVDVERVHVDLARA